MARKFAEMLLLHKRGIAHVRLKRYPPEAAKEILSEALAAQKGNTARFSAAFLFRLYGYVVDSLDLMRFYSDAVRLCGSVEANGRRWILLTMIEKKRPRGKRSTFQLIYRRV